MPIELLGMLDVVIHDDGYTCLVFQIMEVVNNGFLVRFLGNFDNAHLIFPRSSHLSLWPSSAYNSEHYRVIGWSF
jgi:hypothetical protein